MKEKKLYIQSKVSQGELYRVIKPIPTHNSKLNRDVIIEEGEIIEIRYFSPVNFRTLDDHYFSFSETKFLNHVIFFGKVQDDIKFNNKHSLRDILEQKLFESIDLDNYDLFIM